MRHSAPWRRSAIVSPCARLMLIYDTKALASLVARALPDLARSGFLPPNDLASFLENPAPEVRGAALLSLNVKKALPLDVQQAVIDRLGDRNGEVRQTAMMAVSPLRLRGAIPRLQAIAVDPNDPDRALAMEALCGLPDVRAVSVYLTAIQDLNPRLRKAGESALLAIRDKALPELVSAARQVDPVRASRTLPRSHAGAVRADSRLAGDRTVPEDGPAGLRRPVVD